MASDATLTKLQWNTEADVFLGVGVSYQNVFEYRGNSAFNPRVTFGGTQPTGYDEWERIYGRYKVLGSKIKVSFIPRPNQTQQEAFVLMIIPSINFPTNYTWVNQKGNPFVKMRHLPNTYYGFPASLTSYMTTSKLFGLGKKSEYNDRDFSAAVDETPPLVWFWTVSVQTLTTGNAITNYGAQIAVTITYYVKFYQRKQLLRGEIE